MCLVVVLTGLTLTTGTGPASAATAPPYPRYDPQTTCSPWAKPGTVYLSRWLLNRYPGSRNFGISRQCHIGGRSEHKEGRAFDWGLNANSARDRAYASSFITYLFRTYRGVPHYRARRMGVMYLIWNRRIYSSWNRYGARVYTGASAHRDHMHISLSRAGGWGRTPWFTYRMPSTTLFLEPDGLTLTPDIAERFESPPVSPPD